MSSILLVTISMLLFYLGYRFYSKFISDNIYKLDETTQTPAHKQKDGVDFVPASKHILFGHHFTSIAGAAPIIGPCIAVYWGWLPAVLWVVLGAIFMGAVHDFGALAVSLKEKGRSIADIASDVINTRVRVMFLVFVMCLSWLVLAVFAMAISKLFTLYPSSVLPVNIEIAIAIIMGYAIYRKKINSFIPSVVALVTLYIFIYLGTIYKIDLSNMGFSNPQNTWIILLFFYSSVASLLPVWLLLQPRDYINSHQLLVGLGLIYLAIFVYRPEIAAPAINLPSDGPPIIPFLFVTIACGAISGFHGLVSSGTTSKQIDKAQDARLIGYGSMLGEGSLALAAIVASVCGIALVTDCTVNGVFHEQLSWGAYYSSWSNAAGNKFLSFVLGGSALLTKIGLSMELAGTLISVLIISFAATTLDTATRIQRMIITEIGNATDVEPLKNRYTATVVAVVPAYLLTVNGAGWDLWPVFGASNQMLAALTLMILSIYFWQKKRNVLPLALPMIFIMAITIVSLLYKANEFFISGESLLLSIDLILIALVCWMIIEGVIHIKKNAKQNA